MNTNRAFLPFLLLCLVTFTASAQEKIMRFGPGGKVKTMQGDLFDIPELGAIIVVSDSGGLKVEHAMPPENRPKGYADVDIKTGDGILVVNGKRVKTIKDIEQQYKGVPVGGEVKLGLQRGQEMMITRFAKADPKDLPKRKMMIVTSDGPGGGDLRPLPGLGMILGKGKEGVVVKNLLDNPAKPLTDAGVKAGDRIVSIDGKEVKTLEDFSKTFEAIAPGAKMKWVVAHAGKELSITLAKPESQGKVIIRRKQE